MTEPSAIRTWRRLRPASSSEVDLEDDAGLLALVARGDVRAFEVFYDRTSGPLYGVVLSVVRDPDQAEEVTQEVFVEIWRTASRYDPARGSARSWTMTMAHHRAVDRVRSAQAAADRERNAVHPEQEYDVVAEEVDDRLDGERVRRCLGGLTERQRESIRLAYYSGYSYPEVAKLLNLSLGTVKTRMRDGLIRMRDCLGVKP